MELARNEFNLVVRHDEAESPDEDVVCNILALWDMDQDVKMVGHDAISENGEVAKGGQVEHELEKAFFFSLSEDHALFDDARHAVVVSCAISLDSRVSHGRLLFFSNI